MTAEQLKRFETALLNFVERASNSEATTDEVQALPAVAKAIVELLK